MTKKQASGPFRITPDQQTQGKQLAIRQLLGLLAAGGTLGLGARAAQEFSEMPADRETPVMPSSQIPQPFTVHALRPDDSQQRKIAAADSWLSQKYNNLVDSAAQRLPRTNTLQPLANEWGIPAAVGTAAGGAAGGYKLLDWLLKAEKQRTHQNDLQAAEDDYENALSEQYRAAMQTKQAGDDLGIDALYEAYLQGREKQGSMSLLDRFPAPIGPAVKRIQELLLGHDGYQMGKGVQNAAFGAIGLGSGLAAYNHTRGQTREGLLQKALRRRQQQRQTMSPPPLLATITRDDDEKDDNNPA